METDIATILAVDDEADNLEIIKSLLSPCGYRILTAGNGKEALEAVSLNPPDLILLDIRMPLLDGYAVCRYLKQHERTRLIPVVMLTSLSDSEKVKGFEAGADDFLNKDFEKPVLLARVRSLIRMKRLNDQLLHSEQVIFAFLNAIQAKDPYTQEHVVRVKFLSEAICHELHLSEEESHIVRIGATLHDIGKIGMSDLLLKRAGPLTDEEYEQHIHQHPDVGANILKPLKFSESILHIVRHHHERLDGSGYPDGLKADQIPLPTRIIMVADVFDALIVDRPYRRAMSKEEVFENLHTEVQQGRLDADVVQALERLGWEKIERICNSKAINLFD